MRFVKQFGCLGEQNGGEGISAAPMPTSMPSATNYKNIRNALSNIPLDQGRHLQQKGITSLLYDDTDETTNGLVMTGTAEHKLCNQLL
jgi:hypothetical protein